MITAVVPCAGCGTRLAPLTEHIPKELLPVRAKPLLHWTLEEVVKAGLRRAVVVGSPDKPLIKESLAGAPSALEIDYVEQPQPLGLGDALTCARPALHGDGFAVVLPDNLLSDSQPLIDLLHAHAFTGCPCALVAEIDMDKAATKGGSGKVEFTTRDDGLLQIRSVTPKDGTRFSLDGAHKAHTIIGRMVLPFEALDRLEDLRPSAAGELDDVPLLQHYVAAGQLVGVTLRSQFFDTGIPEGYYEALRALTPM